MIIEDTKIEMEYKEVWYLFKLNQIKFHVEHSIIININEFIISVIISIRIPFAILQHCSFRVSYSFRVSAIHFRSLEAHFTSYREIAAQGPSDLLD